MITMGSGRRSRDVLDFLSDPEKAKAVIKAHKEAADRHTQASEANKKAKAEASAVIKELEQKQTIHNERENHLNQRHQSLTELSAKLNDQISNYNEKLRGIQEDRFKFEEQKQVHHQNLQNMTNALHLREQSADKRAQELNALTSEIDERLSKLRDREAFFSKAIQTLKTYSDQFKA